VYGNCSSLTTHFSLEKGLERAHCSVAMADGGRDEVSGIASPRVRELFESNDALFPEKGLERAH
jgi:hypothetical protein